MDLFIFWKKDSTALKSEIIRKQHFLWWRDPSRLPAKEALKLCVPEKN
jgi:hypothetical protein